MYYIYSLCIALIIFIIINNFEKKQTITVKDLLTFIVLYIIITFVSYYLYSTVPKEEPTPSYIPENIQTGFNIASS
jgi:drug/metabolite transporter (DMT)-like permease